MNARADTPEKLLSIVPLVMGFEPKDGDIVLVGVKDGRLGMTLRFDADALQTADDASDIADRLARNGCDSTIAIGYGTGQQITPAVDKLLPVLDETVGVKDALRVEGDRYFSYCCTDPDHCPVEGRAFERESAVSTELRTQGLAAERSREALAARVAAPQDDASLRAWEQRPDLTTREARDTVLEALQAAQDGRRLDDAEVARLAAAVEPIPTRDLAWSAMTPDKADAHLALWTDVVHRTPDAGVAAPGSFLAWAAWQKGEGALANVALEGVEQASPGYSMAQLLDQAISAGLPPAAAVPPITPEEVVQSYPDLARLEAEHDVELEA
jgi:Domain of unknown function (DUF4192)